MDPTKPAKRAVEAAARKIAEAAEGLLEPPVPGAPSARPPSVEEPTEPHGPYPPKPDQDGPETRTPTGAETDAPKEANAQQGAFLTTAQGVRVADTDHSLTAGERGPTLLQDHHLREKVMHFDHERIPERVVHARGAGAHGTFVGYGTAAEVCRAAFLAEGAETPVFVRFSTVLGSRGSADTVRDTRGFATKFYTEEGNFDLVGNNMPVFFIQDGIKFPDIIHAGKPHPDREIPQAQSAHDTFWDFVSLHTEAQHHTIWNMSDRAIPRSYRMMEGFGVHTFRLTNAAGETSLVKFHWKPALGVHSLTWEEAQLLGGLDPDYHRRDLYDAIESGAFPEWELGVQVLQDNPEQTFEGIDLLDPTKFVPEELAPIQPVGRMTLHGNPTNFFAETEQVAFHTGHLVPGIDASDDPLLAARNFSYPDTQLTRLGGPNFAQIPINRPHVAVNDNHRDGFMQQAVHGGVAPYRPNSLDGGCPFVPGGHDLDGAYLEAAVTVAAGQKTRHAPASFADHFSQARMFWRSMSVVEQDHIVQAYTFELGKCYEQAIKERQLLALANIDSQLCARVARGLGLPAPKPSEQLIERDPSPALSQIGRAWPVAGRIVGIVVDVEAELDGVKEARQAVLAAGGLPLVIAAHGGALDDGLEAQRTFLTGRSVELDGVLLAGWPGPAPDAMPGLDAKAGNPDDAPLDPRVALLLQEAYRHAKPIGAWGVGGPALEAAGVPKAPGVVVSDDAGSAVEELLTDLGRHRVWERFAGRPTA
jgi:catalase